MTPSPGEIWLADIPFTDGSASKIRPVLVLWLDAGDAVVAAVTSAATRSSSDVFLQNWQAEGLRVASTVRLSRLDCLEQNLLRRRLGALSGGDAQRIKQIWASQIQLRFSSSRPDYGYEITRAGSFTLYGDPAIINV